MRQRTTLEGLMFVAPWIVGALLFFVYPIIVSLRLSFSHLDNVAGLQMTFNGLDNYKYLIFTDTSYLANFLSSVKSTCINTPVILVFSLIIADVNKS